MPGKIKFSKSLLTNFNVTNAIKQMSDINIVLWMQQEKILIGNIIH